MSSLLYGIDVLQEQAFAPLRGRVIGLFTNLNAVDSRFVPTYRILTETSGMKIAALFAPEHSFAAATPDGIHIHHDTDPRTGIPIFSLYGSTFRPTPSQLSGLEALVCDIQDVGVRYYTYLWTLTYILEAAGAAGVEIILLDRPNPLGGATIWGGLLEPGLSSIVGRFPIPIQHGLTLGELAVYINTRYIATPPKLTVIPCKGWTRETTWHDTGRVWIPPSPNMPTFTTVQHYPGACLLEGTSLSEGRGTAHPFEVVGAGFIDPYPLANRLNDLALGGVRFRPHRFQPTGSKWAGRSCGGVHVHITDTSKFYPFETWLTVIREIRLMYPDSFAWLPSMHGTFHFDRLIGSSAVRGQLDQGVSVKDITAEWADIARIFQAERADFLLY